MDTASLIKLQHRKGMLSHTHTRMEGINLHNPPNTRLRNDKRFSIRLRSIRLLSSHRRSNKRFSTRQRSNTRLRNIRLRNNMRLSTILHRRTYRRVARQPHLRHEAGLCGKRFLRRWCRRMRRAKIGPCHLTQLP